MLIHYNLPISAAGQAASIGRWRVGQIDFPQTDAHYTRRQLRSGAATRVPTCDIPKCYKR